MWVPRLLSPAHRERRLVAVTQLLQRYERGAEFLDSIVTCDETWVHYVTPESKRASKQWKHTHSPPPKKGKVIFFSGEDHGCCVLGFKGYHSPGLSHWSKNYQCAVLFNPLKVKKKAGFSFLPPRQRSSSHCSFNDGNSTETEVGCPASSTVQSRLSSI
jgi:hypothetical protein